MCTPFLKMDLNQDASRNEDEMSVFRGIQKIQFGENAIIFDEMGEGQEASSVNYCRYNFLIKSGKRQPVLSAFIVLTADVAKVI